MEGTAHLHQRPWLVGDKGERAAEGREGSVVGMMFSSSLLAGIVAPIVMGFAIEELWDGDRIAIFFMAALITAPSILVLAKAPITREAD